MTASRKQLKQQVVQLLVRLLGPGLEGIKSLSVSRSPDDGALIVTIAVADGVVDEAIRGLPDDIDGHPIRVVSQAGEVSLH
jgi:hypothetical protein